MKMEKKATKTTKKKTTPKAKSQEAIIEQLRWENEIQREALDNLKQEADKFDVEGTITFVCFFSIWFLLLVSSLAFWSVFVYGKIEIFKWVAIPTSVIACIATIEMIVLCFRLAK